MASREEETEWIENRPILEQKEYFYTMYADLFPKTLDATVQDFFMDLSLLFARQDGYLAKHNTFQVRTKLFGGGVQDFKWVPQYIEPWLGRIRARLQTLTKYRIGSGEKIRRLLMTAFQGENTLQKGERQVLEIFLANPGGTFQELGAAAGVADTTIRYNFQKLQEKIGLNIQASLDVGLLKLRHYIVFVRVPSVVSREELNKILQSDCRVSLTSGFFGELADNGYWAWASYWIPDQRNSIASFKEDIYALKPVFHELMLYEVESKATGINLSFFDNNKWFFNEDVFAQGLLEFAKEWGTTLPPIKELHHSPEAMHFDKIDFLLAIECTRNYRSQLTDFQQILEKNGVRLTNGALSLRLKRLREAKLFEPFVSFHGLGLPNFLAFLIECDEYTRGLLTTVVSQFPRYYLSVLDNGLLLAFHLPDGVLTQFRYLFETLREDVDRLEVFHRYSNLGSGLLYDMANRWNEKRQYWEYTPLRVTNAHKGP